MKDLNFRTGMVVGNADPSLWSQVAVKPLTSGYLAILARIEYSGDGELLSLPQVGTQLIDSLKDKLSLTHDQEELKKAIGLCIEGMDIELNVNVGAMLFEKNKLFVSVVGDIEVYIARDGKVGRIASSGVSVAGKIEEGDNYSLVTVEVPSSLGLAKWKEILLSGQEGVEQLAVEVHGKNKNGEYAMVEVEINRGQVEEKQRLNLTDIKDRFINLWQKPLHIRQEQLKFNAWIGGGLTLLLLFGIVVGVVRRSVVVKERAMENINSITMQRINEARAVGDLNPERAKYLLNAARSDVTAFGQKSKEEKYIKEANKILEEITKAEEQIFKKEEVKTNTFIESNLLAANFEPESMVINEKGSVFLFEMSSSDIWGVSLSDKSSWKIVPKEVKSIKDISSYKGKLFVLNNEGVFATDEKKDTSTRQIEPDDLWSEPRFVDQYAGNIYVLDKGQGEIWKYPVLTDGFGARRRWLAPGIELDLSNVSQWAVDGDIWLITSTGKLERYRRGVPVVFPMEAFPYAEQGRLSAPSSIFLTEDKVYVAENGANRIVVFDKESGKYDGQYVSEEFAKTRGVVVSEGKCYVLVDGKIIWFEL